MDCEACTVPHSLCDRSNPCAMCAVCPTFNHAENCEGCPVCATEAQDSDGDIPGGCPKCGGDLGSGYGLAGGGIGVYTYCLAEGCDYFDKTQDPPEDE